MNLKTRFVLFIVSLTVAIAAISIVLEGYYSQSIPGRYRDILLEDDAINFWFAMTIYSLLGMSGLYGLLQAALNHPLFGGNVTDDVSAEFQAKVIKKSVNAYIDEAETFYKYGDKLAAKLAVQKGLSAYPESVRLKELEAVIKHGGAKD